MSEGDHSSDRVQNLVRLSIPTMLVLFILFPFSIDVRMSYIYYPTFQLDSVTIFAWTWVYDFVPYNTCFSFNLAFYRMVQQALLPTIFQIIFFGAYVGFYLGLTTRKTTIRLGIIGLLPALLVMGVNLLGILVPGASSVIIQIPVQAISILGLVILRLTIPKPSKDEWLPDKDD